MQTSEFEELLTEAFPRWEQKELLYPQILKIGMTGSGFLDKVNEAKARQVIQLMKGILPKDAALYWRSDTLLVMEGQDGAGSAAFYFYVASEEDERHAPFRLDDLLSLLVANEA